MPCSYVRKYSVWEVPFRISLQPNMASGYKGKCLFEKESPIYNTGPGLLCWTQPNKIDCHGAATSRKAKDMGYVVVATC